MAQALGLGLPLAQVLVVVLVRVLRGSVALQRVMWNASALRRRDDRYAHCVQIH